MSIIYNTNNLYCTNSFVKEKSDNNNALYKLKVGGWFWEITDKNFFGHFIIIFSFYVSCLVYAITNSLEYKGKFGEIGFTILKKPIKLRECLMNYF